MTCELRRRLLATTVLIAASVSVAPAVAQQIDPVTNTQETSDVGDDAPEGETIIVTGSRIASPSLVAASPIQIVDAADIAASGVVNIQEVLLDNPVFGTPGLSRTNSNFLTSSVGVASIDLRNLGSDRTLVLVNGRRFVAGVPSSATVDLNTIPTQFVERVDIVTGGASSIYGSDAVAGVVNLIYKQDFEGLEAGGQIGISEQGDDLRQQLYLMMGANVADGRGNVMVYGGYSKEGAVFGRDRARSRIDQISLGLLNGNDEDLFTPSAPFLSSFAPGSTVFIRPAVPAVRDAAGNIVTPAIPALNRTFDRNGNIIPLDTNGAATGNPTGFNRQGFRAIAVPTERYLLALRGNYEVSDNINAIVEGTFAKTSTVSELEPFPLDSAGTNGIFPSTGGRFNIETRLANGTLVRNPFVPDFIFNNAPDTNGDSLRDVGFNRRLSDFGNRGNTANRTTFRILGGLEGQFSERWSWDIFYAYGETTESQRGGGQVNVLNFANALNVITNEFGTPICADANARARGCAPANIFGTTGSISPEAIDYIIAPQSRTTRTTQSLAGANVSGDLFELWDGSVGLAAGVEYRKEFSEENNDALTEAGLNGGNAIPSSSGSFDVYEAYGEVVVPLLADRPFFHLLQARGAGRVSDYSSVGTTYSWSYGLEWAPIPDIRFRALQARATRAPNISELFLPPSQTFPTGLTDPCVGVTATTGGTVGTQCRADPGVQANIALNGAFTLNQADIQGISGFNRGNSLLFEEEADTFTAGVIINPTSISALRNLALTVDYFDIKIEDAIVATPRQFILNQCFTQGVQSFCDFVTRRPGAEGNNSAGSLNLIDSAATNSGGLVTEGIDVTLSYRQNVSDWGLGDGAINARVAWTHVLEGFTVPLPGADRNYFNREIGASQDKIFGTIAYENDDWGLTLRGTYIGPAYLDDQTTGVRGGADGSELFRIDSEFYADLQFKFTPGDNYEFYVGADNVFDKEPPPIITGLPGNTTGAETDASTYDAIGRRFYAGARLRF